MILLKKRNRKERNIISFSFPCWCECSAVTRSSFLSRCNFIGNDFFLMLYLNIKKEKVEEREHVCADEACRSRD